MRFVFERRRVLGEVEAERVDEEGDGGVIVVDDDGDELEVRHGAGGYPTPSSSTSKMSSALGGMTPPAPCAP